MNGFAQVEFASTECVRRVREHRMNSAMSGVWWTSILCLGYFISTLRTVLCDTLGGRHPVDAVCCCHGHTISRTSSER